jgi:hypothetical protein
VHFQFILDVQVSSDVSIRSSSSCGSTMIVTDFANGWNSVKVCICDGLSACTAVLVDGMSSTLATFARSITLWSVTVGCY